MDLSNNNNLSVIQWNSGGLSHSKLQEFKDFLHDKNPHIVLLSETHWKENKNKKKKTKNPDPSSMVTTSSEPIVRKAKEVVWLSSSTRPYLSKKLPYLKLTAWRLLEYLSARTRA